jgi:manganese oxidase
MQAGMVLHEGHALSSDALPAFGRSVNLGAQPVQTITNMPLTGSAPSATPEQVRDTLPNVGMFPGYPQDMLMVMDDAVAKPETHGLRAGWSAGTMGMMTVIRVVEPDLFESIQRLKADAARKADAR